MPTTLPKTLPYEGDELTFREIARLNNCDAKVVYRYYARNHTMDGFQDRRLQYPKRIPFEGKLATVRAIAKALGASEDAVRQHFRRRRTMEGFGENSPRKGKPLLQLERFYHTLDESIPLDRCIAAAGYRSIRQFCKANDLSDSLVGCWRRGKIYNERDIRQCHPNATLVDEMTNFQHGISIPLYRIMVGTGCLEWELFPNVFTKDFYNGVYEGLQADSPPRMTNGTPIERRERRRVVRAVLHTLPDRLREVVELTFGVGPTREELTYDEIGRRYGLTRERARQLLNKAVQMLMDSSRRERLAEVSPFPDERRGVRTTYDVMKELWVLKGLPYWRN